MAFLAMVTSLLVLVMSLLVMSAATGEVAAVCGCHRGDEGVTLCVTSSPTSFVHIQP